MWKMWYKSPSNICPHNYSRCRKCRCNIPQHHNMPIKTMDAVDTTEDRPIIADEKDVVRNAEEIGEVEEVFWATVI